MKKAVSVATTATLLASLFATAAAATAAAAVPNTTTYLGTPSPASGSVAANGVSTIVIPGTGTVPATQNLYITITGASFASASGQFKLQPTGAVTVAGAGTAFGTTDFIVVRAPTVPGTATITEYVLPAAGGNPISSGTMTLTFYASSALAVSVSQSVVEIIGPTATCDTGAAAVSSAPAATGADRAKLCVTVNDGNGNAVGGVTVNVTISPVGLLNGAQATNSTANPASFILRGTGLAGVATIGISVSDADGNVTSFPPKTFTFTGSPASITATAAYSVGQINDGTAHPVAGGVTFVEKDSAGNQVASMGATVVVTGTVLASPATGAVVASPATTSAAGTVDYTCGTSTGSATIAVKDNGVTSNAVTVYCSGPAATFSVAFDKTTIVPGGTATVTVTVKDANGLPAPDQANAFIAYASSGAVFTSPAKLHNGTATFTYLAPFNAGVATVVVTPNATVGNLSGSQSASITIGTPAPVTTAAKAASALGVTTAGPFTTATKIPALGKYVTVKMSFGAGAANQHVAIFVAKKVNGVWSSFSQLTGRIANSNGDVYFYWRSSSAAWLSIYGQTTTSRSNAVQVRWM